MPMAATVGKQKANIIDKLLDNPKQFDFFQALRLLRLHVAPECVRLQVSPNFAFSNTELEAVEMITENNNVYFQLTVNVIRLIGNQGILPPTYTENVLANFKLKKYQFYDFLMIFQQRVLDLFYEVWLKNDILVNFEGQQEQNNQFITALMSMMGLYWAPQIKLKLLPVENIICYANYYGQRVKTANALANIVSHFFRVPVTVDEYQVEWVELAKANISRMPDALNKLGNNNSLGKTAVMGGRVRYCNGKVLIKIGPLTWQKFNDLLPGKKMFADFIALVRSYLGIGIDFDTHLVADATDVAACQLGNNTAGKLAWNTWLPAVQEVKQNYITLRSIYD